MNNELKLTDEQVEKAAAVTNETFKSLRWGGGWGELLRAAAPFLQAPLAEPTGKEADDLACYFSNGEHNAVTFNNVSTAQTFLILQEFVARRNAPPTVDPRKAIIVSVLGDMCWGNSKEEFADKILAALDSEAGK